MAIDPLTTNATTLERELSWFTMVIDVRLKIYFGQECEFEDVMDVTPPPLQEDDSVYASIVNHYRMNFMERVMLVLALAPHIRPQLLDVFFTKNTNYDRGFTEFGGIKGNQHGGFLPTGETVMFILGGTDLDKRFSLLYLTDSDHFFFKHNILKMESGSSDEPFLSGALTVTKEYLSYFTTGATHKPDYSMNFPAKRITTQMEWDDLVFEERVMDEIGEVRAWIQHGRTLMEDWGLGSKIKPGYRCLFYGPPGTGKTLTACLLGKATGLDVYRIDLSMVVSKYIGETEKNLAGVFDQAENKNWILFFDEADALFGKRTATKDAHDRYANQEVAYLLQRIEDFPGVIILATNLRGNLDEAFARRFQSMIFMPAPGAEQRLKLWENAFSDKSVLEKGINLEEIAQEYKLTGGAIINVLRYCSLMALRKGTNIITHENIKIGIQKEYRKEGKPV